MTSHEQEHEHDGKKAGEHPVHHDHHGRPEHRAARLIPMPKNSNIVPIAIVVAGAIVGGALVYDARLDAGRAPAVSSRKAENEASKLERAVLPKEGVVLPVSWGDLGIRLVEAGVIDREKFEALYRERGAFTAEFEKLLNGTNTGNLKITEANSGYLLNLLWALGLGNESSVLEKGEMMDPKYGGAGRFASTGGWTAAKGPAMDHYSKHSFVKLSAEQEAIVERVSRGIYRPCCGNSTHFPDCNHGMAMLGLLQIMASQGVSESDMYKTALAVNSYWFPDTYLTIANHMKGKGVEWKDADPREMLGAKYSSAAGYRAIVQGSVPQASRGGASGCGLGSGGAVRETPRQGSGCGI